MDWLFDYIPLTILKIWAGLTFLFAFGVTLKYFSKIDRESEKPELELTIKRRIYNFLYLIFIPFPFIFIVLLSWSAIVTLSPLFLLIGLVLTVKSYVAGLRCRYCGVKSATVRIRVPPQVSVGGLAGFYCESCAEQAFAIATIPEQKQMVIDSLNPLKRFFAAIS